MTFFFNGGRETPFEGEDRILVPSPKVATYDLKPEMSAYEVKDKLVGAINTQEYDFIVVNFANGDMVGHTGVYNAIAKAVHAVDNCVKTLSRLPRPTTTRLSSSPTTAMLTMPSTLTALLTRLTL